MSKQDAPAPEKIPKKRKEFEDAPDHWLRVWETLDPTPSQLKKIRRERERRKEDEPVSVAILRASEGMTPQQKTTVRAWHDDNRPNEIIFWTANFGGGKYPYQGVIKQVTHVIACPKETARPLRPQPGSVWEAERYAHHRKLAVTVIMPDGEILEETDG